MRDVVDGSLVRSADEEIREIDLLQDHLHDDIAEFVYTRLKRRPMILPVVVEVPSSAPCPAAPRLTPRALRGRSRGPLTARSVATPIGRPPPFRPPGCRRRRRPARVLARQNLFCGQGHPWSSNTFQSYAQMLGRQEAIGRRTFDARIHRDADHPARLIKHGLSAVFRRE